MCGRFYIDPDDMTDAELIALLDREKARSELNNTEPPIAFGEIKPGQMAAVIALNRRQHRSAFPMKWGYSLQNRLVFNARSETAAAKPMFAQSTAVRRCLIPASAYFEWDHRQKPYTKYCFHVPEQRMIYLAGLYRFESENSSPVFTILTRQAEQNISCFHDRMPLIIPPDLTDNWLNQTKDYNQLLAYAYTQLDWHEAT